MFSIFQFFTNKTQRIRDISGSHGAQGTPVSNICKMKTFQGCILATKAQGSLCLSQCLLLQQLLVGIILWRLFCDLYEMSLAPTSNYCADCSLLYMKPCWQCFGSPLMPQRQYVHDELFYSSSASLFPAIPQQSDEKPEINLPCSSLLPVCSWDVKTLDIQGFYLRY